MRTGTALKVNYSAFIDSLEQDSCPDDLAPCLQALWYDARGDWDTAHEIVQHEDVMKWRLERHWW